MASIYESTGPQIGLTGPGTAPSFQPGQAFDPSRQMLQQSELDLRSFASFSQTLTNLLTDTAKKKNEEEYQLGLADVLNGTRKPTPEQLQQNQTDVTLLKSAAEADNQVANDIAKTGSLDVSQQFKADSKAISGWRAYGQAVGSAKQTASDSQAFFMTWMENSKDKVIPTADGRMISPAEASSPSEIQAALEIGQQRLISQGNLSRINPTILAEHLAPSIQAVKGQMYANKLSSEVRKAKETAISDTAGFVRSEFNNPNLDVPGMSESFQRNVSDLVIKGDLSRGAANDLVIREALASISSLDEMSARAMIAKLVQVRKIANDPNSITLGAAYPEEFSKVMDVIEGRVEQQAAKADREMGKQAEQAWGILKKAEQDATMAPGDLQNLRKQTISVLGMLADKGSTDALKYRTELLSDPINIDPTLYRQLREGIAQGKRPTDTQISGYVTSGKLSQEQGRELGVFATTSDEGAFKKQFGSSISDAVKAKLKEAGAVSLDPFNRPETNVLHVEQVTNDLVANVFRWRKSQLAKGQTPDDNDINQFVINELPRTIGRYFQQNPNTKTWTTRPLSTNPSLTPNKIKSALVGSVIDASGFNPRTIQLRSMNSGSSVLLSKEEVTDNINRLTNNQPLTRKAQQLANTTTGGAVSLLTQQAQHQGIDPTPIQNSPQAKQQAQYAAVAPWATQRLNASGGNYLQQMLNLQRIVEAQNRAARMSGDTGGAPVSVKSGPTTSTKDLIRLGMSQGLDPEKAIVMAAIALGESGGRPTAHNPNRSTGDNSFGLWQINMIDALGPERARALGIKDYEQLKDPNVNARAMKMILASQGLNAWSVFRNGIHRQFLPEARRAYAELRREQ
jgi:hypothetical protein